MSKVLCFGELLLRFSPQLNGDWITECNMPVYVGGAELNTATALARWGIPVRYFTALPDHYLSREIISHVAEKGIEINNIKFSGNRIGTYYLPQGTDLKGAGVIYDRAYSSFWKLQPGQVDWDAVFEGVDWFHFSAICPALNKNVALVCKEALAAATKKGITCSVDLNYRAKLWQWGKQPVEVMPDLAAHCQIIMGNIWAAEKMLGIAVDKNIKDNKEAYLQQSHETSKGILNIFPSCKQVAHTFRFDTGGEINYYATLYKEAQLFVSQEQQTRHIVDKVGSGDTFMAGLIYGIKKDWSAQKTVDFAAAAAFNKLFIRGDATTAMVEQIQNGILTHG